MTVKAKAPAAKRAEEDEDKKVATEEETPEEETEEETPETEDEGDEEHSEPDGDEAPETDDEGEEPDGDEPETEDEEDEEYEEDEKPVKKDAKRSAKALSLAALMGLPSSASLPAQKARIIGLSSLYAAVKGHTGKGSISSQIGALQALADDAAAVADMRSEVKATRKAATERTRLDLLRKLSAANIPGYQRSDLFSDKVKSKSGKLVTAPAPAFAEMKIGTLRALVDAKLATRTQSKSTPYAPDASLAAATVAPPAAVALASSPALARFDSAQVASVASAMAALHAQASSTYQGAR